MLKEKRRHIILMFVLLSLFWLALAGTINLEHILIGLLVSFLVILYSIDLIFNKHQTTKMTPKKLFLFLKLIIILVKEMVVANFQIAKIILSKKMPLDEGFVKVKQPLKKEVNQALYGNFITLTPGTLTVKLDDDIIFVHGLTKKNRDNIVNSPLEVAFKKFEGDRHD